MAMKKAIDWTQYDTLKAQGLADREIARQWGIPWGTFHREKSKREAISLQPTSMAQQTPRVSKKVPSRVSDGAPYRVPQGVPVEVIPSPPPIPSPSDMTPLLHDILQELRTLTQGLAGRVSPQTPPVSIEAPRVSSQVTEGVSNKAPKGVSLAHREKTERWNLHLPIDLITKTKARTQGLGVHPSELVAEILRQWLTEEDAP